MGAFADYENLIAFRAMEDIPANSPVSPLATPADKWSKTAAKKAGANPPARSLLEHLRRA